MIEDLIAKALKQKFENEDLSSYFLVNVEASKNNKITVYVDADDKLTIDMCRIISRFLEKSIEEGNWMPEKYTLDVSSPGIDNPLRMHRQYVKNIGRKAKISCSDGSVVEGLLKKVDAKSIAIENKKGIEIEIPFNEVNETKILVSFK